MRDRDGLSETGAVPITCFVGTLLSDLMSRRTEARCARCGSSHSVRRILARASRVGGLCRKAKKSPLLRLVLARHGPSRESSLEEIGEPVPFRHRRHPSFFMALKF
jgi:hypothetical protein